MKRLTPGRRKILEAIKEHGPVHWDVIGSYARMRSVNYYRLVADLRTDGLVTTTSPVSSFYTITDAGSAALAEKI